MSQWNGKRTRNTGHPKGMDGVHLRPWPEVAERWNATSGEGITRSRVMQIAREAERKLRVALEGE